MEDARTGLYSDSWRLSYSRYLDFGKCTAPDEREWEALTTPVVRKRIKDLPSGWPQLETLVKYQEPDTSLTNMEPISTRFRRQGGSVALRGSDVIDLPMAPPPPYQRYPTKGEGSDGES
jgi:hypothetical protein